MNTSPNQQAIKKLIKQELPILIKNDKKIRDWILQLAKKQSEGKAKEIESKIESRFDRLLEELKRDREEQSRKWDGWEKKWEAHEKIEEKKLAELTKKWEAHEKIEEKKWAELTKKWEAQEKKWEENQKEIRKLYDEIQITSKKSDRRFDTTIGALGARWGGRSESSFRNALKGILEDLGLKVEHLDDYDAEGMVFGRPGSVEMDIIIKNGLLMLCELKSSISKAEMCIFYNKTLFYEKKYQRKGDRLIVISPMVEKKALEVAKELGIKVYSHAEDIPD